ncbi:MAG: bifunctional diaminohydroxyphosphoribosylaminopyrimidine deaminase/5-amino-6-(5-phosphoribosylamino)uracil reductase RibD [Hyphomicrobium sp.]|nr:bifunctional diaminohydroxyphosphoribosylaminopyrimidine deaminase/5-amino-6-(5-phosphoribosylamino)uracil reductase RibD [Hyphomicrobium sp.]
MMEIALVMARRGLGATAPNPSVGAVVADEGTGEILARAVTADGGRPHAETRALAIAGPRARGKTMYVTLEPCAHHGRTPPCADALIAAGLARVVVGTGDPDPRTAGQGVARLRAAGVAVDASELEPEAHWVTLGHILRVTESRPFVQVKIATDADGNVPRGRSGHPVWVTSAEARAFGHLLRAEADAILVGAGTVRDDDPELTCRLPGLVNHSPVRVVLTGTSPLPTEAKLYAASGPPVWAIGTNGRIGIIGGAGARPAGQPPVSGRPSLRVVLASLAREGMTRLLVEGGPRIWRAFADAGYVDEVVLFMAGHATCDAADDRAHRTLERLLGPVSLRVAMQRTIGSDTLWRLRADR